MGTLEEKELLSDPEVLLLLLLLFFLLHLSVSLIRQTPSDDHGQSSFGGTTVNSIPVSFSNIPSGGCQENTL